MDEESVPEDQCSICSKWPAGKRASLRREHFSTDYIQIPTKDVCERCEAVFWANRTGLPYTEEQLEEALRLRREGKAREVTLRLASRGVTPKH